MSRRKYDVIRDMLLSHLKSRGPSTHKEILSAITEKLKKQQIKFDGSIEWHMEWVKLDLESRREIKRLSAGKPVKFDLYSS